MAKLRFERTILLVTLTALGITWILFSRDDVSQPRTIALTEAPIVGHLAPDFALKTPQGETINLADYVNRDDKTGKPVVLNYWASWCGPCRLETPELQNASLKFKNQVAFLGINQGESAQIVSEFALSYGLTYPLLVDEDNTVYREYGINSLPTTIFIDREGVVREVFIGILNQAVIEDRLKRLLEEG